MNYEKTKSEIRSIQSKYATAGDVLFRCAIQHLIDVGARHLTEESVLKTKLEIEAAHDLAKSEGKHLIMTSNFEIAIVECAAELAKLDIGDLLIFIQREMYYDAGDWMPSYNRLVKLVQNLSDHIMDINDEEDGIAELRNFVSDDEMVSVLGFDEAKIFGGDDYDSEC